MESHDNIRNSHAAAERRELAQRLREHAAIHDQHVPHDDEQAVWARDLRAAADLLSATSAAPQPDEAEMQPDTTYLGCARMGAAGASDEEVLRYVRLATGHAQHPDDAAVDRYAAIEAYQRQQWRPIETAPQDGRVVLGVHGRQRPFEMYRGPHGDWLDAKDRVRDPSHWMPLPPAPDLPTSTVDNPLENPMTDRRQPGAALVRNTTSED